MIDDFVGSQLPKMIYQYHKDNAEDWRRPHLGASIIGKPCARAIWYSFRWVKAPDFDGRMLRLFETGHLAEERLFKELRGVWIKIHSQQKKVFFAPHFSGSVDAIGEGFPESKKPHLIEVKTYNQDSFNKLVKEGLEKTKPEHIVQMNMYMGGLNLERAYYFAINKNTDEVYAERIKFDKELFTKYLELGKKIITSPTVYIFDRIADNPARFACKFCDYKALCHGHDVPEVNCRTCIHSTPIDCGRWHCNKHSDYIPEDFQKEGCQDHLFMPDLINREIVGTTEDSIEYDNGWVNKNNSKEYMV